MDLTDVQRTGAAPYNELKERVHHAPSRSNTQGHETAMTFANDEIAFNA